MTRLVSLFGVRADQIGQLLDAAFGIDRQGKTAYRLRDGLIANDRLSFAAIDGDSLVGSVQCWPIQVAGSPLILVGPVAVLPERQNQGVGHLLMKAMLDALTPDDPPTVMIGDAEYYYRFGFSAERTGGWTLPGPWEPHRLLLRNPADTRLPATGEIGPRL